jgi:hypothetical protein
MALFRAPLKIALSLALGYDWDVNEQGNVVMPQMGFFDLSDCYASRDAKKDPLLGIDAVVTWEAFRPALERIWRKRMRTGSLAPGIR